MEYITTPTRLRYLGHDGFGGFIRGREYMLELGSEETYGELFVLHPATGTPWDEPLVPAKFWEVWAKVR